jgi:hypothetical protein
MEQIEIENNGEIVREPDDYTNAEIKSETKPVFTFDGKPPIRCKEKTALKFCIYGKNGIGKTTFVSKMKKPIFLDLEKNMGHLIVDRIPIDSFIEFERCLEALLNKPHDYLTVAIDSIDKLEALCFGYVKEKFPKDLNFGKDYRHVEDCLHKTIKHVEKLFIKRKMNVVFIGHETTEKIGENPTSEDYGRFTPRIREKFWTIIGDWVNCILYATNEKVQDKKAKGKEEGCQGRVIYTTPTHAYVAKNTYELKPVLPLDWEVFRTAVNKFYEPKVSAS